LPYLDIKKDFGNTVCLILDNSNQHKDKAVAAVAAVEGDYTGKEIADALTRITGIPAAYKCARFEGHNRKEIYGMVDFFVEFGSLTGHDTAHARNASPRPSTTLDQLWKRYESFRPQ
ncbi:hypothetical protein GGI12_002424, partial [Dipsacomyces acuminosporus]